MTNSGEETSKERKGKMSVDPYGIHPEVIEPFGPWMLAKRNLRHSLTNQGGMYNKEDYRNVKEKSKDAIGGNHGGAQSAIRGSQFAVLDMVGEENHIEDPNVEVRALMDHQGKNEG